MGYSHYTKSKMQRKGFTLVELLVVIGIISLLMSMLMPALSKAKELARSVACKSNLRSNAMSVMLYTEDNNDYYPTNSWHSDITNGGQWPLDDDNACYPWSRITADYRNSDESLLCPTARANNVQGWPDTPNEVTDYGYSSYLSAGSGPWGTNRTGDFMKTAYHFMLGDSWYGWWDSFTDYGRMQPRHNGKMNIAFLDAHVDSMWMDFVDTYDGAILAARDSEFRHQPDRLFPGKTVWRSGNTDVIP